MGFSPVACGNGTVPACRWECNVSWTPSKFHPPSITKTATGRLGWAMESTPEAHVKRVKERLQPGSGREILEHLSNLATYGLQGTTQPYLEQITLPPPLSDDYFYAALDEGSLKGLKTRTQSSCMPVLTEEEQEVVSAGKHKNM